MSNPTEITGNTSETFTATGGVPPYEWSSTCPDTNFAECEGLECELTAGPCPQDGLICIEDYCGSIFCWPIEANPVEFIYDPDNPTIISAGLNAEGEGAIITVIGGEPPFQWETDCEGLYFSEGETQGRTNLLQSIDCTPGEEGTITVSDLCGSSVGGEIELQPGGSGGWVYKGAWLSLWDEDWAVCREFQAGDDVEIYSSGGLSKWVFKGYDRMCSVGSHIWNPALPEGCTPDVGPDEVEEGDCAMEANCRTCPPCEVVEENCTQPCNLPGTVQWYRHYCYKWEC